jgi:hypothetical protein
MRSKLLKAFKLDCEFAAKALRTQGSLATMFVIRGHGGEVIPMMFADGTKEDCYRMVQLAAIAHDAEAVSNISEAWTLPAGPRPPEVLPADSERRIEVIAVQIVTLEEALCSMREIIRDAEGKFTGLGPERVPQTTIKMADFGGYMSRVIPPERPDQHNRETAETLLKHFAHKVSD